MTTEDKTIVKRTWRKLMMLDPVLVADLFYTKLFNENPQLRKLFPKEMNTQNKKLTDMLTSIITSIDHLDELKKDIGDLARKHVNYRVQPRHYEMVGTSLLWTIEQGLGSDWNIDVKNAWVSCYTILAEMMIKDA